MGSQYRPAPLIVIVGPTASGKSALAIDVAKQFGGEIICADSRTVYKGMDIGTAKPSPQDQMEVKHHMIDVVEPSQQFTAAEFKEKAVSIIEDISSRGKLAIMVGGTGLYVDGVIFDFAFLPTVASEEREVLQALSVIELQDRLKNLGIPLPNNSNNPRHLIRSIETNGAVAVRKGLRENTLVLGLDVPKAELTSRITKRIENMINAGLEQEVSQLAASYGWNAPGLSAVGYKEWQLIHDLQATKTDIISSTIQYAKRQRTWFRRNLGIVWVKNGAEALALVKTFLQR